MGGSWGRHLVGLWFGRVSATGHGRRPCGTLAAGTQRRRATQQGQTAIALQEIAQAQAAEPQWIAVHNLKALVLEKMGQSAMAKNSFEEGLRLAQRNPSLGSELADLQHNWGLWLCQQGQTTLAVTQFQRAMSQPGYALRNKTALAMSRCDSLAKG